MILEWEEITQKVPVGDDDDVWSLNMPDTPIEVAPYFPTIRHHRLTGKWWVFDCHNATFTKPDLIVETEEEARAMAVAYARLVK